MPGSLTPPTPADALPHLWLLEDSPEVIATFEMLLMPRYDLRLFETLAAFNAARLDLARRPPRLLIADLLLPDGSFLDLLDSTSWAERPIKPLLVTSALTDIAPMRQCLAHGAVDYIVKPFVANELLVKIERALIAVPLIAQDGPLDIVRIDHLTRCVEHDGRVSEPLTAREIQIMSLMRETLEAPIKRSDIVKRVWGTTKVTAKCLDVHLSHLRAKVAAVGLEIRLFDGGSYQLMIR
jgi:DNA-binding response OmpR family regulator